MSKYFFATGDLRRNNEQRYSRRSIKSNAVADESSIIDRSNRRSRTPQPPPTDYTTDDIPPDQQYRDRSHSTGNQEKHDRRSNLADFETRRKYVSGVLDRYYSHPSNRYHSMPSSTRKQQLVDTVVTTSKRPTNSLYVDDTVSEISSYVVRSARATPEPSFYDDDYEEQHPRTFNGYEDEPQQQKLKSRFFRSSSIRSLKKLMNKLRGSGNYSKSRSKTPVRPATDPALYTASHDSGLETPSDTSVNYNSNQLHPVVRNGNGNFHDQQQNGSPRNLNLNSNCPPALCGILNHGNTCYINAIVQCLSNTDLLAEYFLSGRYLTDLNNNLRNAGRYGSQGNVTVALAEFLQALWFNTYKPDRSMEFKRVVEKYSEQYRGNQQQDAQEFLFWLSDRVHEDLNVAVKRRYKLHKSRSKNEDELATAAMEKHLESANSFVSARFHGLFLSSITCPVCYKQSTKPDPFMCISLPVSQSTKRPLFVVIVFQNRQPRQIRFGLNADVTASFREVKKCLADATGLNSDHMIMCEMNDGGLQTTLADQNEVITLGHTKCVWAVETPPISYTSTKDDELILLVANQTGANGNGRRLGSPVALKVHREVSYGDLCRSILLALRPQLRPNTFVQDIPLTAFRMRLVDDYRPMVYVPQDVALPLYTQAVDNALSPVNSTTTALHLKIMLEWQRDGKESYFGNIEEKPVDHASAQDLREQEENPEIHGLRDCLAEYTKPELCQWYCPDCHRRRDDATKRIVLYWLPDVLVLHLKRFKRQSNGQLVKLDSTVWFPITNLDLTDFMYQSSTMSHRNQNQNQNQRGRPRTPSMSSYRAPNGDLYLDSRQSSQNLYDLYAVCNHSGYSPNSGHYTAYCRNPVNGRWFCYDDQSVSAISERDLVTNSAYLLFYERRQARISGTLNGQHSSMESGFIDHWYFRLCAQRTRRHSSSSKDTLDGIDSNGSSSDSQQKSPEKEQELFATATKSMMENHQQIQSSSASPQKLYVKLPEMDESRKGKHRPDQQQIDTDHKKSILVDLNEKNGESIHQRNGNQNWKDSPKSIGHGRVINGVSISDLDDRLANRLILNGSDQKFKIIDRFVSDHKMTDRISSNHKFTTDRATSNQRFTTDQLLFDHHFPSDQSESSKNGHISIDQQHCSKNGTDQCSKNGHLPNGQTSVDQDGHSLMNGQSENDQSIIDRFDQFDQIALPSCSKILTTGVAAPVHHIRTHSTVETDL